MKRICRSLISKDSFIIIHFLAAFIMSENSSKSRYSPSCHLTEPQPGNIHWDGNPTLHLHHAQPDGIYREPLPENAFRWNSGAVLSHYLRLPRPVGTNLCLEPSQAQYKTTTTDKQFKDLSAQQSVSRSFIARNGFLPPLPGNHKDLRIKAKIKSDVCVSY